MKPDCKHALSLWLTRNMDANERARPVLFANASVLPEVDSDLRGELLCQQSFRPDYLALEKVGLPVSPELPDAVTKDTLFLIGRNRKWNEHRIAFLWNQLNSGERLVIAGDKNNGIASIRKWFSSHMKIEDSFSKYHAMVFWAIKADTRIEPQNIQKIIDGYQLAEGMFSSDGPDAGSRLLVEHFDNRIKGEVADLGAGWGYLSAELLKKSNRVTFLELFEADFHALEASKINLASSEIETRFQWCDVTTEFPKKPYHWVIMNPPFHSGRAAEPELGKRFIQVAASTLPSGGRLLMVANRNLPYEDMFQKVFKRFETLEVRDGFKVIEAMR